MSDLVPFTRRPLVLVIDCDNSEAFEVINGVQKGETVAMLLSSSSSYHATLGSSRQSSGSLFTIFLTAPVQAFCLLLGISRSLTLTTLVAVLEAVSTEARKQAAMEIRLLAKNKLKNRLKIARNVVIKPLISLLLSSDLQF
ncbi:uncharacterized protein [Malus domestica]|uniref:uncharacterized protein n=1 Tax=Malus domestica TaxID=3750 RepID=UPI003974C09E